MSSRKIGIGGETKKIFTIVFQHRHLTVLKLIKLTVLPVSLRFAPVRLRLNHEFYAISPEIGHVDSIRLRFGSGSVPIPVSI